MSDLNNNLFNSFMCLVWSILSPMNLSLKKNSQISVDIKKQFCFHYSCVATRCFFKSNVKWGYHVLNNCFWNIFCKACLFYASYKTPVLCCGWQIILETEIYCFVGMHILVFPGKFKEVYSTTTWPSGLLPFFDSLNIFALCQKWFLPLFFKICLVLYFIDILNLFPFSYP